MRRSKVITQLVLLLVSLSVPAEATKQASGVLTTKDLNSTVTGSKTTYLELVRKVLPDLQVDPNQVDVAVAHASVPFRHLSEDTGPATLEGDLRLDSFQARWIKSEGRRVLLLELDMSAENANEGTNYQGEAVFVAAFTIQPAIKLLDVMDIKTDRFTGFWEKLPVLQLTSRSDVFLVNSSHSNAGESYNDLTVLFLNDDRIETITNIFILDTQGCGATFTETPLFRILPGTNQKYPNLMVDVRVKKDADSGDCNHPTRGYLKSYQAVYRWNAAKREYRTTSRQLQALDKFNRKRL